MAAQPDVFQVMRDNPWLQDVVVDVARGDLTSLHALSGTHLRTVTRSVSVIFGMYLGESLPRTIGGVKFAAEGSVVTFDAESCDPVTRTVARCLAVDATAALNGALKDPATHETWLALWDAVPRARHPELAGLLAGRFSPLRTIPGGPDA